MSRRDNDAAVFATYDQAMADIRAATAGADLDPRVRRRRVAVLGPLGLPAHDRGTTATRSLLRERIDGATGE